MSAIIDDKKKKKKDKKKKKKKKDLLAKLAAKAEKLNIEEQEEVDAEVAEKEAKTRSNLETLVGKLNKLTLKFELKAGDEGKLFGSVTAQMIADAIAEKGYEIDRKEIQISEAIKSEGSHFVEVRLNKGFTGKVKVKVKGS